MYQVLREGKTETELQWIDKEECMSDFAKRTEKSTQNVPNDDLISRKAAIEVASGYCHPANIAKELAKLPSAQPDLSGYSDRLWKKAYERGKREAQSEIVRCKDCGYYKVNNPRTNGYHCCYRNHNIFQMREDDYCSRAERREE